ncbi:hypothetical protein Tco_1436873, partial [Tanacetum coccineum]
MEIEPDIKNMTMNEYLEYEAAKERQLWDDVQSRRSPSNYDEADVDSFHQNKSKTFSYLYSHNLTPPHPCILPVQFYPTNYLVYTNESNDEHDDELEEDQEEDENVIQPLIPKTLHTTPPNEDYVAPDTKSILDDLLEEFRDEILNVTMVNEGAKCNPTKDLEELERLLVKEP